MSFLLDARNSFLATPTLLSTIGKVRPNLLPWGPALKRPWRDPPLINIRKGIPYSSVQLASTLSFFGLRSKISDSPIPSSSSLTYDCGLLSIDLWALSLLSMFFLPSISRAEGMPLREICLGVTYYPTLLCSLSLYSPSLHVLFSLRNFRCMSIVPILFPFFCRQLVNSRPRR